MDTDLLKALQKALSGTGVSHIRMYEPPVAKVRVNVPAADESYFYTAGRAVSYFPKINANGMSFFREDCKAVAQTLQAALADVQHIKPGYPSPDPKGEKNTSMGAIADVVEHDEGIDILVKNEREVAKAMGYTEDEFKPGKGCYSAFSQECDFKPLDCKWIVVDKADPSKLVKEVGYLEGLAQGFRCSRVVDGKWSYYLNEGNPVYIRIKPTSFTGVGHVMEPADSSAVIYSYASDSGTDSILSSLFPGMEGPNMTAPMDNQSLVSDFMNHPDLATCSVGAGDDFLIPNVSDIEKPYGDHADYADPGFRGDKARYPLDTPEHVRSAAHYFGKPENRGKYSKEEQGHIDKAIRTAEQRHGIGEHADSCYAAVYSVPMYKPNGAPPVDLPAKAFKIKDQNGNFNREKLIAAYHALSGLRGNTSLADRLPPSVRAHALLVVRQGLNETKPKENNKSVSQLTQPGIESELLKIEDRKALIEAMALDSNKAVAALKDKLEADHAQVLKDKDEAHTKAISAKDAEITSLSEKLKTATDELSALKAEKVVASRVAQLEAILPFGDEEKKSDTHAEYVKSLASYSDDRFETELLKRQNAALKSELKGVKAVSTRTVNPIPGFTAPVVDDKTEKLSVDTLY